MDNSNHHQPEEHYTPDMAGDIDLPAEILAEDCGITVAEANRVFAAIPKRPQLLHPIILAIGEEWRWIIAAPIVTDVIRFLIIEARNLRAKVWGLVFSSDMADVANGNRTEGIDSMADVAKRIGVSRALLSSYKRLWDEKLGRYGRVFGKSPEACEENRKARYRVLGFLPEKATKSVTAIPAGLLGLETPTACFHCGQNLPEERPAA